MERVCKQCGAKIERGSLCNDCKMRIALSMKKSMEKKKVTLNDVKKNKALYSVKFKKEDKK